MSDQPKEHVFTKAQLRHFNELQQNVRRAQEEMQAFVDYLGEEHGLDQNKRWQIGARGFIEQTSEQAAQAAQMPIPNQGGQNGHPGIEQSTPMPMRDEG
jgi:hypothetical protein